MPAFYNEYEIEQIVSRAMCGKIEIRKYARFLLAWLRSVNENSDGWAYWRDGADAGNRIADLLIESMDIAEVSEARWKRAIENVRKVSEKQRNYGNRPPPVPSLDDGETAAVTTNDEVTLRMPRAAWKTMRETLEMDAKSSAFDRELRAQIRSALNSVKTS